MQAVYTNNYKHKTIYFWLDNKGLPKHIEIFMWTLDRKYLYYECKFHNSTWSLLFVSSEKSLMAEGTFKWDIHLIRLTFLQDF